VPENDVKILLGFFAANLTDPSGAPVEHNLSFDLDPSTRAQTAISEGKTVEPMKKHG
jgi:hypothetical protein